MDIPGGKRAKLALKGDGWRSGRGGSSVVGGFDRCRIFAGAELVEAATGACLGTFQWTFLVIPTILAERTLCMNT